MHKDNAAALRLHRVGGAVWSFRTRHSVFIYTKCSECSIPTAVQSLNRFFLTIYDTTLAAAS